MGHSSRPSAHASVSSRGRFISNPKTDAKTEILAFSVLTSEKTLHDMCYIRVAVNIPRGITCSVY